MKLLIIPDCHAHPDYDNRRFDWLGQFLVDELPDVVVCLGDFVDLPSLCSHSSAIANEGRRYGADMMAGSEAMHGLMAPLKFLQAGQRGAKKAIYKPRLIMCLGNHEDRINRLCAQHTNLQGTLSEEDLPFEIWGWETYSFQERVVVEGVCFSHSLPAGVSGRPISGNSISRSLLINGHMSSVVGHAHTYSYSEATRWDGQKVFGLCAGCYSHDSQIEGWNRATQDLWWNGVVLIDNLRDGYGDVRKVSQDTLRRKYGSGV